MHFVTISSVLYSVTPHFRQSTGLQIWLDGSTLVLCHLPCNFLFLMFSTPLCMHRTRSSSTAFMSCVRGPVNPEAPSQLKVRSFRVDFSTITPSTGSDGQALILKAYCCMAEQVNVFSFFPPVCFWPPRDKSMLLESHLGAANSLSAAVLHSHPELLGLYTIKNSNETILRSAWWADSGCY